MMDDKNRIKELEKILSQMLTPVKDIPFSLVIRTLAQTEVQKFDPNSNADASLLGELEEAANDIGKTLNARPIISKRPNEAGNYIESFIQEALCRNGYVCSQPTGKSGKKKSSGYPDLIIEDPSGRYTYVECKTYKPNSEDSTFRSFYLSPSPDFKVSHGGRHLLLAFEMDASPTGKPKELSYIPLGFKILDLTELRCDVKYEFNSNNKRMYGGPLVLSEGKF